MLWATSPHGVAEAYDLDLDELLAMADYLEVDLQQAQQQRGVLEAVAQAAVFPLTGQWSMHIAQGGKMYWHDSASGTSTWTHPANVRVQNLVWAAKQVAAAQPAPMHDEAASGVSAGGLAPIAEDDGDRSNASTAAPARQASHNIGGIGDVPPAFPTPPTSPDLDNFVGFMEAKLSHVVSTSPPSSPDGPEHCNDANGSGRAKVKAKSKEKSVLQKIKMEGLPPIPTLEQLKAKKKKQQQDLDGRNAASAGASSVPAPEPSAKTTMQSAGMRNRTGSLRRNPGILTIPPMDGASEVKPTLRTPSPDSPDPDALAAISGVRTGRMRRVTFGGEVIQHIPTCLESEEQAEEELELSPQYDKPSGQKRHHNHREASTTLESLFPPRHGSIGRSLPAPELAPQPQPQSQPQPQPQPQPKENRLQSDHTKHIDNISSISHQLSPTPITERSSSNGESSSSSRYQVNLHQLHGRGTDSAPIRPPNDHFATGSKNKTFDCHSNADYSQYNPSDVDLENPAAAETVSLLHESERLNNQDIGDRDDDGRGRGGRRRGLSIDLDSEFACRYGPTNSDRGGGNDFEFEYRQGGLAALVAEWFMSAVRGTVDTLFDTVPDTSPQARIGSTQERSSGIRCLCRVIAPLRQLRLRVCAQRTAADACAAIIPIPSAQAALLRLGHTSSSGSSLRSSVAVGRGSRRSVGGGSALSNAAMCWLLLGVLLTVHVSSRHASFPSMVEQDEHDHDDTRNDHAIYDDGVTAAGSALSLLLLAQLLFALGIYWLLSAGIVFGTIQLSGAALPCSIAAVSSPAPVRAEGGNERRASVWGGYRTACAVVGCGSFSPVVFPGAPIYLYFSYSYTADTLVNGNENGGITNAGMQSQQQQQQLWSWCVSVCGILGGLSTGVRVHELVWQEFQSSHRHYQTGSIERDRWRDKIGRGRAQAEAGARRGARAGGLVALSCILTLLQQLLF